MSRLQVQLEDLRIWLHSVEVNLLAPIEIEAPTKTAIDRCLKQHEVS